MQKIRKYPNSYFQVDILKKGIEKIINDKEPRGIFKIAKGFETLKFDDEREFYADYRKSPDTATIGISDRKRKTSINIEYIKDSHTNISIEGESRGEIEEVFEIFEETHEVGESLIPLFLILHVGAVIAHTFTGKPNWKKMWSLPDRPTIWV